MRRKVVAVWVSLIIMVSSIVILVEIAERVEAPTTLYVGGGGAGNYSKIQWAIDNATTGDSVFVYNGTYFENVVVDKTIDLIGEDKSTTIIDGDDGKDAIHIIANWVNVSGFTARESGPSWDDSAIELNNAQNCRIIHNNLLDSDKGIALYSSSNNTISNNNISSNDEGTYLYSSLNNTISNNNIYSNNWYGIYLSSSSSNIISNNNINSNNWRGIDLYLSLNNFISNNNVYSNNWHGIDLDTSSNNTIFNNSIYSNNNSGIGGFSGSNNTISKNNISNNIRGISFRGKDNIISNNSIYSNNKDGIYLYSSTNTTISNNNIYSNKEIGIHHLGSSITTMYKNTMIDDGIVIVGDFLEHWNSHTIDTSNSVNGKTVYYWKNKKSGIIPSGAGQVILANCTDVIVENQNLDNGSVGIEIGFSFNNTISNNSIYSNDWHGIHLYTSSSITISNNSIYFNNYNGIWLRFNSRDTISNNTIYSNNYSGLSLSVNSNTSISNNSIYSNQGFGISLSSSSNNTLIYNNITSNNGYGIYLTSSVHNLIHHNNLLKNSPQAHDDEYENLWNDTYPFGGNFWSDYNGDDRYKGPNQDIDGSDGIGDMNYSIDGDSRDNYPLMSPVGNCIFLHEGWNLISIPFIQSDMNLDVILNSISGLYDAVQLYNNTDITDHWKHNHESKPLFLNDLYNLNHLMGFWIHITEPGGVLFNYPGTQPTSNQTIQLHPGWNMVGYPSLSNHNRTVGLNNITFDTEVDAIQWFDATTKTWHFMGPDDSFVPGRGYWVHSKVDVVWEVPL